MANTERVNNISTRLRPYGQTQIVNLNGRLPHTATSIAYDINRKMMPEVVFSANGNPQEDERYKLGFLDVATVNKSETTFDIKIFEQGGDMLRRASETSPYWTKFKPNKETAGFIAEEKVLVVSPNTEVFTVVYQPDRPESVLLPFPIEDDVRFEDFRVGWSINNHTILLEEVFGENARVLLLHGANHTEQVNKISQTFTDNGYKDVMSVPIPEDEHFKPGYYAFDGDKNLRIFSYQSDKWMEFGIDNGEGGDLESVYGIYQRYFQNGGIFEFDRIREARTLEPAEVVELQPREFCKLPSVDKISALKEASKGGFDPDVYEKIRARLLIKRATETVNEAINEINDSGLNTEIALTDGQFKIAVNLRLMRGVRQNVMYDYGYRAPLREGEDRERVDFVPPARASTRTIIDQTAKITGDKETQQTLANYAKLERNKHNQIKEAASNGHPDSIRVNGSNFKINAGINSQFIKMVDQI